MLNIITEVNESKTLTNNISCKCKCKFDEKKCNSNQWWNMVNVDVSVKNITYVKKIIFGILVHVFVKMENIQQVLWMIQ